MTSENDKATESQPLRLVIVDATDTSVPWRLATGSEAGGVAGESSSERRRRRIGLTPVWRVGATAYEAAGSADAIQAVSSWDEALRWANEAADRARRSIASLQVWCHGGWGSVRLGATRLDRDALERRDRLAASIDALRDRLSSDALVWFRCCSAFGHDGREFAQAAAERLRCRVAGHTHVIGFFQSGLHSLAPGDAPGWSPEEGVRFEDGRAVAARGSSVRAPNTITCLRHALPSWARDGVARRS